MTDCTHRDWIKYTGKCIIFAGAFFDEYENAWTMEVEEHTKKRLIDALQKKGIKCNSITFTETDEVEGQRYCECDCEYDKPYRAYYDEFFIEGLYQYSHSPNSPLEFYFVVE